MSATGMDVTINVFYKGTGTIKKLLLRPDSLLH